MIPKAQHFDYEVPDYQWSEETQQVEECGKRNIFKEIQSYGDCALDKVLDKFLPEERKSLFTRPKPVFDSDADEDVRLDLTEIGEIISEVQEMAPRYGLTDKASVYEIQSAIFKKHRQTQEEKEKEVMESEKAETSRQEEQEDVSQNG